MMQTYDKNHELFLDLNRFTALEQTDPDLLGKIIQKRLNIGLAEIYRKRKADGLSVAYSDKNYPGCLIREDADGKRFIITYKAEDNYQESVIREIPPR